MKNQSLPAMNAHAKRGVFKTFTIVFLAAIAAVLSLALAPAASAAVNVLSYWHLGESDPGSSAGATVTSTVDSAGTNNLKFIGQAKYVDDAAASALTATSSSRSVNFTNAAYATNTVISTVVDNFGIECWVKPTAITNGVGGAIVYNGHTGTSGWGLIFNGSNVYGLYGGVVVFSGTITLTNNVWSHLALVRNQGVAKVYKDGIPDAASVTSADPHTPNTGFGLASPANDPVNQKFTGAIDEVRVFTFTAGQFSTNDLLFFQVAPKSVPTIASLSTTSIGAQSMTLNGTVNPNGSITAVHFEIFTAGGATNFTATNFLAAGTSPVPVSANVMQLLPNTCYSWRLVASTTNATVTSDTTPQNACTTTLQPLVSTLPATSITSQSATLNGTANPNGQLATAAFQYGTTPAMANITTPSSIGGGQAAVPIHVTLTNLTPNTLYFYSAIAANNAGSSSSTTGTFTTPQIPPPPAIIVPSNSYSVTVSQTRAAKAVGTINANGTLSVTLTDPGLGYVTAPHVAVNILKGSGTAATVTASIAGDSSVARLQVPVAGNYVSNTTVAIVIDPPFNPIQAAITNGNSSIILLPAGHWDANTVITRNVTIRGQGTNLTIIDGGGRDSVFRVKLNLNVTFENLTITGGVSTNGGGIDNESANIVVNNCCISNNQANGLAGEGGGIYNRGPSSCILNNTVVENNTSTRDGGGLSNSGFSSGRAPGLQSGLTTLSNALQSLAGIAAHPEQFGISVAHTLQGVVYSFPDLGSYVATQLKPSNIERDYNTVISKLANADHLPMMAGIIPSAGVGFPGSVKGQLGSDTYGSGWQTVGGALMYITNSAIVGNYCSAEVATFGGGIHNDVGLVLIQNSDISSNVSTCNLAAFGGAVDNTIGAMKIVNCTIRNNETRSTTVVSMGAALNSIGGLLSVQNCDISSNTASAKYLSRGGALYNVGGSEATLVNCTLNHNSSGGGGAVENDYIAKLFATNCTFSYNSVSGIISANGGAIGNDQGGEITLNGCTLDHNSASGFCNGGAIYNHCEYEDWDEESRTEGVSPEHPLAAIANTTATLINCTISSNSVAGQDFSIPDPGQLAICIAQNGGQIANCLNSVHNYVIHLPAQGGGIFNGGESDTLANLVPGQTTLFPGSANLNLTSCTIDGNYATGGFLFYFAPLTASTDGGGIYNTDTAGLDPTRIGSGKITMANTMVALNKTNGLPSDFVSSTTGSGSALHFNGRNLDSDGTMAALGSSILTQANPFLGPLTNNGGPTFTQALMTGSMALNAGDSTAGTNDQRGILRPQGSAPDIGAFEAAPPQTKADSYTDLENFPLIVAVTNGVLVNDAGASLKAQINLQPSHGMVTLAPDGSFVYQPTNNYIGPDSFSYFAMDSANLLSPSTTVSIAVLPVLHVTSTDPASNSPAGARDHVSLTFDAGLNANAEAPSILVTGSESVAQPRGNSINGNTLTLSPAANFHPGELVTVELLNSLIATNGAVFPISKTYQFTTQTSGGSGLFPTSTPLSSSAQGIAVALSDLDGNGTIDAYVAGNERDEVWLNDGHGNFTLSQTLPGNSTGVALADLNGDGFPDVVVTKAGGISSYTLNTNVAGFYLPSDYNHIYFNDGTGHFTESSQKLIPGFFLDPDSLANVQKAQHANGSIEIVLQTETLLYIPGVTPIDNLVLHMNQCSSGVAIGDLNGDGLPDILLINNTSKSAFNYAVSTPGNSVWLNNGHGSFVHTSTFGQYGATGVTMADVNGDGTLDAIVAARDGAEVWLNDGNGNFSPSGVYGLLDMQASCVAAGDINGDGSVDFVTSNTRWFYDYGVQLFANQSWTNDGHGHFTASQSFGADYVTAVALGDLNGDGKLDFMTSSYAGNRVWMNTGTNFVNDGTSFDTELNGGGLALADLDGDGDLDAFATYFYYGVNGTSLNFLRKVWFNDSRPTANNFNFTVAEDGVLNVPALGVLAGAVDVDGPGFVLQTNTVQVITAPTEGLLIGIVGRYPDYNVANFSYDTNGNTIYLRTVPVFTQNGSLSLRSDGSFSYIPNKLFFGTDSFKYVISDGLLSSTGTVTITVTHVPHPPTTVDDFYPFTGSPLNITTNNGLLANDSDPDGDSLTASLSKAPLHGSVTVNANGSFVYTTNSSFAGADVFYYAASDGLSNTVGRVKIGNTPPVAVDDVNYAMPANGVLSVTPLNGVLANDSDPDGDTLTAVIASQPAHGTVTLNADGSFTYTRTAGYSGNDSFTYQASDGIALSFPAHVKIGNSAPVAVDDGLYIVALNKPISISPAQGVLANDTDAENDFLTAQLVSGVTNGTLTLNRDGSFTYVPKTGFVGRDGFSYQASDGLLTSAVAHVSLQMFGVLQIVSVNPVPASITAPSNAAITINFSANIEPTSVTGTNVLVAGSFSGVHPWTAAVTNNALTLSVAGTFLTGEDVEVSVPPGITSTDNTRLQTPYQWSFKIQTPRSATKYLLGAIVDSAVNTHLVTGDLDGDGHPDVVAWDGQDQLDVLRVYFYNGSNSFRNVSVGPVHNYKQVTLGDFNGDGKLDIFAVRSAEGAETTSVGIYFQNDGTGNFTAHEFPSSPPQSASFYGIPFLGTGDFNGDGKLDVVAVADDQFSGGLIWVWVNDGHGNFTLGPTTPEPGGMFMGATGDMNKDGTLDLMLAGFGPSQLWLNDGTGKFHSSSQVLGEDFDYTVAMAIGDLNGDGFPDAIIGDLNSYNIWLNDGTGIFTKVNRPITDYLISGFALADLDGNGKLDIAASAAQPTGTNTVAATWLGDGHANFTVREIPSTETNAEAVVVADFNGDGVNDVFVSCSSAFTPGNSIAFFGIKAPLARDDFYPAGTVAANAANGVLVNDNSGDGTNLHSILAANATNATVTLNADGSFSITGNPAFAYGSFTYYDVDSNGSSGIARVKIGNQIPNAGNSGPYTVVNTASLAVSAANGVLTNAFDDDGDKLTAILSRAPTNGTLTLKADGSFVYLPNPQYVGADSFTYFVSDGLAKIPSPVTASLNVIGQMNLVQKAPAANALRVQTNATITIAFDTLIDPTSTPGQLIFTGSQSGRHAVTPVVNGNTITITPTTPFFAGELVTAVVTKGLRGTGQQRLLSPVVWQFTVDAPSSRGLMTDSGQSLTAPSTTNALGVVLADVNHDGNMDAILNQGGVIALHPVPGSSATVVFNNNGSGAFSDSGQRLDPSYDTAASGARSVDAADVNGDGFPDLVVTRLNLPLELWLNDGSGHFALSTNQPPAGVCLYAHLVDVNGDGYPDIVAIQQNSGGAVATFVVLTNNGTGVFTDTMQSFGYGVFPLGFAVGDVNSDGSLDIVEMEITSGNRIWLNDGNGNFRDSGKNLGPAGRTLALGDLNGDGSLDAVVGSGTDVEVWFNDGTGTFTNTGQVLGSDPGNVFSYSPRSVKLADMDGDGKLDAVVIQAYIASLSSPTNYFTNIICFNDGSGNLTKRKLRLGNDGTSATDIGIADLNKDGALDLFLSFDVGGARVFTNSFGLGIAANIVPLTVNDNATIQPFASVVLAGVSSDLVNFTISLSSLTNGAFTSASLASGGFTGPSGSTYSHGTVTLLAAQAALQQLVFAPIPNLQPVGQSQNTAFTLVVSDASASRTNVINVASVSFNDAPVAKDDSGAGFATIEGVPFVTANVLTNDTDIDPGDAAQLTVGGINTVGTLGTVTSLGDGTFNYDPGSRFTALPQGAKANDYFSYTINDPHGGVSTARVTISITGTNNAPIAANDTVDIGEHDGTVALSPRLLLNDVDPDAGETATLSITAINTTGVHGMLQLVNGSVTYNANNAFGNLLQGATATDHFTYTIQDVHGLASTASVTINIHGTNDAPVAQADFLTLFATNAATNVTGFILSNDSDPDPGETATLSINSIDASLTKGVVTLTNGSVIYTPSAQFASLPAGSNAVDTFDYVIQDIHGALAKATVTITNIGVNGAPTALPASVIVQQGSPATNVTGVLLANSSDSNSGEASTLAITAVITNGATGTITLSNHQVFYQASAALNIGPSQTAGDSFSYIVSDVHGASSSNKLTVTIIGQDAPPLANSDTITVGSHDGPVNITARLLTNDVNPNVGFAGQLAITQVNANNTVGLATLNNNSVFYTANGKFDSLTPGQTASDSFLYTLSDPFGLISIGTVNITVVASPAISQIGLHSGVFHLHVLGLKQVPCVILASSNLQDWTVIGTATETTPGNFDFDDSDAGSHGHRFYKVEQ